MPSFVIHHIAGVKLLEKLEQEYDINLGREEKSKFLMGNLIVDSVKTDVVVPEHLSEREVKELRNRFFKIIKLEKSKAHFREMEDKKLVVQVPKVENFTFKYASLLKKRYNSFGVFISSLYR